MPGPIRKHPNRRQRSNGRLESGSVVGRIESTPPPDDSWRPEIQSHWETFWKSSVAHLVDRGAHLPALRRLFSLRDRRIMLSELCDAEPLVTGSQGQTVLNPAFRAMMQVCAEVRMLEDRFGMSPRARLQLGITLGEARPTLEDLNRSLGEEVDADGDEEDPRIELTR